MVRQHGISIHALREEGDTRICEDCGAVMEFLSTPSARTATADCKPFMPMETDFYPRPPRGGRLQHRADRTKAGNFYPRPPRGGRPSGFAAGPKSSKFLSTPSARRATAACHGKHLHCRISIHALREEGDSIRSSSSTASAEFLSTPSARRATVKATGKHPTVKLFLSTPSARRATLREPPPQAPSQFLSTPSARRATPISRSGHPAFYFYPRPPRGGRLRSRLGFYCWQSISIHALREEGDTSGWETYEEAVISIHALREEGDCLVQCTLPGA